MSTAHSTGVSPIGCADVVEHSPTPWEYTGGDIWIDTRSLVCCGDGRHGQCCGNPDVEGGQELVAQTSEVNAAFIVKAVNNHERLVATLTELVSAFNPSPAFDYFPLGIWDRAAEVLASLHREAIAEKPCFEGVTPISPDPTTGGKG